MKNVILNNLGLKLLSLFLAIITWFYVVVELQKGTVVERETLQSLLPYNMVSKQLPVKLNLTGEPQKGYVVAHDKLIITPSTVVIIGPKSLINRLQAIETQPIDVSGYSKTISKDVSIVLPVKGVTIKDKFVNVTIPIVKAEG